MTFEHLMMMHCLPDVFIAGIDIEEVNAFIRELSTKVKVYWETLVNVDLTELDQPLPSQLIETSILKVDDAELLLYYSVTAKQRIKPEWQELNRITDSLLSLINEQKNDDPINIVPPNIHKWTIAPHFSYLLDLLWRENTDSHEYYMLFAV